MNELSDQLSRYRREPVAGSSATAKEVSGKRTYEAFDKAGKPCAYTEIRCVTQPSQSPQSRFLLSVTFSADYNDTCTLIYSFMAVEIKGRNLMEIRRAIQNGRCEFIQEFHENEFLPPGENAAVIESIRFITGDNLNGVLAPGKAGK